MKPARLLAGAVALSLLLATPSGTRAQERSAAPSPSAGALAGRSLLLPGWGQQVQGQRRAWAYALAEAGLWALWFQRRRTAAGFRDDYRDLAWRSARLADGTRVDGPWAYYEDLSHWGRSGAFDSNGSVPGIQPETDPSTFNGSAWALARDLHFRGGQPAPGDPAYEAALAWYWDHAYGPDFLWDWSGREADLAEYNRLIDRSDARFRQATTALGLVLANHVLSSVDAFVSSRLPGETFMHVSPLGAAGTSSYSSAHLVFTLSWAPPS